MLERTIDNDIVTVRLAHGKASAMDAELIAALESALEASTDARAMIITGTGSIFSAGVDLHRLTSAGDAYVEKFVRSLDGLFDRLLRLEIPVVAAVNGHAIAGGCIIAVASDYRLMTEGNGRIGVPELLVGVPFPPVILELLRASWPPATLGRLVFTGHTCTAPEALALGVIDEVAPAERLNARAAEVAAQMAAIPRRTFAVTKRQLRAPILERAKRYGASWGKEAEEIWRSEATHAHIREYVARTIGQKK